MICIACGRINPIETTSKLCKVMHHLATLPEKSAPANPGRYLGRKVV
jgi:hypothetical protein